MGKEYKRKKIIDKTHNSYRSLENKTDISLILRVAEKLEFFKKSKKQINFLGKLQKKNKTLWICF